MASKNKIKVTLTDNVKVNDDKHIITVDHNTSITVELADTTGLTKDDLKKVRWIANVFEKSPTNSKLHKTRKGSKLTIGVPEVYSGGGLAWLEPVLEEKQPKYTPPYGYFINSFGPVSIDRIEWREYSDKDNGAIITEDKFFTEGVQLHIYTKGLFGQYLQIRMLDRNIKILTDKRLDLDENVEDEENALHEYFRRPVKVYTDPNDKTKKEQKVIVNIRLEKKWMEHESDLDLYPAVKASVHSSEFKYFNDDTLTVREKKTSDNRALFKSTKSGNKATVIGTNKTDPAEFKPCFFTKIDGLVMRGEELVQEVKIYQQGGTDNASYLPVTAGVEYAKAKITLKVNSDTDFCLLSHKHKDRVIDMSEIDEAIVVETRIPGKKIRIADSDKVFSGGEKKSRDSADNNDGDNKGSHVSISTEVNGPIGFSARFSKPFETDTVTFSKGAKSDTKVEMELAYHMSGGGQMLSAMGLLSNIWPIRRSKANVYPIRFHTCRKDYLLNILVYSDVKWLMSVGFNYDLDGLNKMRKEEHKKYKLETQKLEKGYKDEVLPDARRRRNLVLFKERALARVDKAAMKRDKSEVIEVIERANFAERKAKKDVAKWEHKIDAIDNRNEPLDEANKDKLNKAKEEAKIKSKSNRKARKKALKETAISLAVEYDRPYKGLEVTADFKKAREFVDHLVGLEASMRLLLKGEHSEAQNNKSNEKKFNKFAKALKGRPLFSYNYIPPSIAIVLSWYAEHPKKIHYPAMGVVLEGTVKFAPMFGFEINMDVLALVSRAHPIARGIVTVMDLVASLLGDAEIKLDLSIKGLVNLEGTGRIDTYTKETNFNREHLSHDEDDTPFETNGSIELSLVTHIKLVNKSEHWLWGTVVAGVDIGGEIGTGINVEAKVKADTFGMYAHISSEFMGIKLSYHASVFAEAKSNEDSEPYFEAEPVNIKGDLILMDSYQWPNKKVYIT